MSVESIFKLRSRVVGISSGGAEAWVGSETSTGSTGGLPWRPSGGLLIGIVIFGLAGLALNQRVKAVIDEAIRYDVELENLGDRLQDAVDEVRFYHRSLAVSGPSRSGLTNFDGAYTLLL
jgi:hypothetical protein